MDTIKMQIAQRIKAAREAKGISQVAMAKQLDIARQTYLDLESGKTEPRVTTLLSIAILTQRPFAWFIGEQISPLPQGEWQDDIQALPRLYAQLPVPLRRQLAQSHVMQLQACVHYMTEQ
ncbi:helix-turn-helix domain-containing protein [Photobacterium aphoticum]|uniref:HTH cro/C1-type domain-containing protein n=1 Tax=Photobacterium aphoticum TaxID=754436 RepID=A0A0J1GT26_9GAMM|nr:helix-turn-helix transcriptional regulator [Photobacterium aphoticum]KLV02880.1 hypothetical protein ABT58_01215 [Photobacterium aphoticum]PSU45705.1 XRE family transcriptional regulator [Photobacterium aphoticum]GHA62089.1 hypothetical protein GCM10007086_39880 [Photobacterium aphoticum]